MQQERSHERQGHCPPLRQSRRRADGRLVDHVAWPGLQPLIESGVPRRKRSCRWLHRWQCGTEPVVHAAERAERVSRRDGKDELVPQGK